MNEFNLKAGNAQEALDAAKKEAGALKEKSAKQLEQESVQTAGNSAALAVTHATNAYDALVKRLEAAQTEFQRLNALAEKAQATASTNPDSSVAEVAAKDSKKRRC